MKFLKWIGIFSALSLILSCFLAWTYHPDLNKEFTGFYSENNIYGRPGLLFVSFSIMAILLFVIPRVWAKRVNIFVCGFMLAFAIRSFMIFSGCYVGICPDKKAGIWLMLFSAIIVFASSLFPDLKLKNSVGGGKK